MRVTAGCCIALLLSAACGCAQSTATEGSAQSGAGDARGDELALPRFIGVVGTKAQHAPPFLGVPDTNFYCLRSFIDRRSGETLHQLYVSDSYSGTERQWDAARDEQGHSLRFVEIGRHEITCDGGCAYLEEFAADIPESQLRANPRGLTVIFSARSGAEKRISLSDSQVSAQLSAVDRERNPVQPTAALTRPQPPSHQ